LNKYSQEEKASIWYNQDEVKEIRNDIVKTVKRMMKGENVDGGNDTTCSRGLEFKEPKKNKARQKRKLDIICAVLVEQESLWDDGQDDDVMNVRLAEIYRLCNWECSLEARKRGISDALAAKS
jgi:hypothetical protein